MRIGATFAYMVKYKHPPQTKSAPGGRATAHHYVVDVVFSIQFGYAIK